VGYPIFSIKSEIIIDCIPINYSMNYYFHIPLSRLVNTAKIPLINLNVSIKILCDFTRKYREETPDYEVSSHSFYVETKEIEGKKIYVYEKEFQIKKIFDLEKGDDINQLVEDYKKRVKVHPFMINHQIIFNFAAIIVYADIGNRVYKNQYICNVSYMNNNKRCHFYKSGYLSDSILFCGPILKKGESISQFLDNYKVDLKVI